MTLPKLVSYLIFTTDPRQLMLGAFIAGGFVGWWLVRLAARVFQANASPAPAPGPNEA
ncbi:hypothetical protein [Lysobacter capsici]|uniref:hypothetical protein n=1 Tax=Lysobacter capsici TaxID=435897 RepID=UPI001364D0A8|nr:hypothetical protein [Lysobacter capsici]